MNKGWLPRYFPIIVVGILIVWWGVARYLESATQDTLKNLQEREKLVATYGTLQKRWSAQAQKEKRRRFVKWMKIRHVPYHESRARGKIVYEMTLHHDTTDEAVRRIFNLPLLFTKMQMQKVAEDELKLKMEMPE